MLMRTDPFRDFDRLAQQVFGTPPGRRRCRSTPTAKATSSSSSSTCPASTRLDRLDRREERADRARRAAPPAVEGVEMLVGERPQGTFSRQLFLGEGLDTERIDASYADGVLTLRIPVAEGPSPAGSRSTSPTHADGDQRPVRGARRRRQLTEGRMPCPFDDEQPPSTRSAKWQGCSASSRRSCAGWTSSGRATGPVRRRPAPLQPPEIAASSRFAMADEGMTLPASDGSSCSKRRSPPSEPRSLHCRNSSLPTADRRSTKGITVPVSDTEPTAATASGVRRDGGRRRSPDRTSRRRCFAGVDPDPEPEGNRWQGACRQILLDGLAAGDLIAAIAETNEHRWRSKNRSPQTRVRVDHPQRPGTQFTSWAFTSQPGIGAARPRWARRRLL